MSKFNKRKIAATLAFASLFSGKSQAMETKSSQRDSRGAGSKINSTTNKKGLPFWARVLIPFGVTGAVLEAYNEVIALARGDKPKTLFTGKYSFTELARSRNKKKASEIKNDKDLKENMEKVTGAIYKNNCLEETYSKWGKETFEKFNKNKKDFEHKKVESVDLYTIIDENNPNFDEIKQFIILNVSPRTFSAAKKLGKKIVPVLQIQIKQSGEMKICLYFACEDKFEDYLNGCFIVYDHGLPFDIAKSE